MERPTCGGDGTKCPYWEYRCRRIYTGYEEVIGVCRIRSVGEDAEFPERFDDEWCGEHPDFPRYLAFLDSTKKEVLLNETQIEKLSALNFETKE